VRRLRNGEIDDLIRNTIIWIAVVIWLAVGYMLQTPAGGPYTDALRHAFAVFLAIVIPLVSAIVVAVWVGVLRKP